MTISIWKYVAGYTVCQANKVNTHPTIPALSSLKSDCTHPFQQVSMDFITDLPPNGSFDSVMVIVDHVLMKGVILCPCNKNINVAGIAKLFFLHVFHHYGLHDKCISDQVLRFFFLFFLPLTDSLFHLLHMGIMSHDCPCDPL